MTRSVDLKNIIVYRYILVKCWEPQDGKPVMPAFFDQSWQLAKNAWEWLQINIPIIPPLPLPPKPKIKVTSIESQRIAGFRWAANADNTRYATLDARVFPESSYLLLGLWKQKGGNTEDIHKLQKELADFAPQETSLSHASNSLQIDESYCLYAEIAPELSLRKTCRDILEEMLNDPKDRVTICEYSWGCVGIPRDRRTPSLILKREGSIGIKDVSLFANDILPRLALLSHSIKCQYSVYEEKEEELKKQVQKLAKTLRGPVGGGSIGLLEKKIKKISSQLDKVVEELGKLKIRLIAMGDNVRHIKNKLQDPIFDGRVNILRQIYEDSNCLLVEQVRVDFQYFQAYNEEAQLSLQTLQAFVEVEQAKLQRERTTEEKLLVAMLGIVGLILALVDGFSDVIPWRGRAWIVIGGIIIGMVIWLFGKSKEK